MEDILEHITLRGDTSYICGDFNIDISKQTQMAQRFNSMLISYNFVNLIKDPTRVTLSTESTLDLILTNDESDISSSILSDIDISDHFPISVLISQKQNLKNVDTQFRNYSLSNITKFINQCSTIDWSDVYNKSDIELAYSTFFDMFFKAYDKNFAWSVKKASYKNNSLPWITPVIKKEISYKNKLYKTYLKTKNLLDLNIYKNYRNKLNRMVKKAKTEHFSNVFKSTD